MADPGPHRDPPPPSIAPGPSSLHFSAASTLPVAPAQPQPSHQQHPPPFHYPHMYVDPVTVAATAAFYQQQQQPHPSSSQAPSTQQPPRQSASLPLHTHVAQPAHSQPQQQQQPYYLQDPAVVTAAAIQQMHLQMQLQLHAQQQQQQQSTTSVTQPVSPSTQQQPTTTSVPRSHSASVPPHAPPMLPSPPHMQTMHPMPPNAIGMPSRLQPLPVIPEAQMASAYRIGRYTPAERRIRLERYREKRAQRNYNRRVKYDCRKMIADKRRRVQGRFVKREEEVALAAQQKLQDVDDANGHTAADKNDAPEDGTEDGTEIDTKLHQPESSGSGSSGQRLGSITADGRSGPGESDEAGPSGPQESFCVQSDQVLQQFR